MDEFKVKFKAGAAGLSIGFFLMGLATLILTQADFHTNWTAALVFVFDVAMVPLAFQQGRYEAEEAWKRHLILRAAEERLEADLETQEGRETALLRWMANEGVLSVEKAMIWTDPDDGSKVVWPDNPPKSARLHSRLVSPWEADASEHHYTVR